MKKLLIVSLVVALLVAASIVIFRHAQKVAPIETPATDVLP